MVIHVLSNITQEARRDNTNGSKSNAGKIHILIASSIGLLSDENDQIIGRLIACNTGNLVQQRQQAGTRKFDGHTDVCFVSDAELVDHGTADHLRGVGNEFVDEDVVVDAISYRAADHANGKGESSDGSDEVVGADDCCNNGCWDDDATDAKTSENEETPEGVKVEAVRASKSTAT